MAAIVKRDSRQNDKRDLRQLSWQLLMFSFHLNFHLYNKVLELLPSCFFNANFHLYVMGAQWLSGRVVDLRL